MRIAIALVILSGVAHAGGGGYGGGTFGTSRRVSPTPHICCEPTPGGRIGRVRVRPYVPITIVERGPQPLARDLGWRVERLRDDCFERDATDTQVRGRLSIEFALVGFHGEPVQIRVWGLDEATNRCVAAKVARWSFDRYSLGWEAPKARVVAWVGYNDLPRLHTLRAAPRGRACAD